MKKSLQIIVILIFGLSQTVKSQKEEIATAIGGAIISGVAIAATIHNITEELELTATEYILKNYPEINKFKLQISDLGDKTKLSDLSRVSCLTFYISILSDGMFETERRILFMYTSMGWINEYGLNHSLVKFELCNKIKWNSIYLTYIKAASSLNFNYINSDSLPSLISIPKKEYIENDSNYVIITDFEKSNKYFRVQNAPISYAILNGKSLYFDAPYNSLIPFYNIDGDTYSKIKYSDEITIVYNERTLGMYFSSINRLVQLKRSSINLINEFVNPKISF